MSRRQPIAYDPSMSRVELPPVVTTQDNRYTRIKKIYKDWPGSLYQLHLKGLVPWWIEQACLGFEPKETEPEDVRK